MKLKLYVVIQKSKKLKKYNDTNILKYKRCFLTN